MNGQDVWDHEWSPTQSRYGVLQAPIDCVAPHSTQFGAFSPIIVHVRAQSIAHVGHTQVFNAFQFISEPAQKFGLAQYAAITGIEMQSVT